MDISKTRQIRKMDDFYNQDPYPILWTAFDFKMEDEKPIQIQGRPYLITVKSVIPWQENKEVTKQYIVISNSTGEAIEAFSASHIHPAAWVIKEIKAELLDIIADLRTRIGM